MGLIGKILKSVIKESIREITTEIYTNYNISSRHVSSAGIDSVPIEGDQGVSIVLDGTPGKTVYIGVYPDPQAKAGEVRFYSRDSDGNQKAEIWIKDDGNITISNDNGFCNLKDDGIIELNGNADFAVRFSDLETAFNQHRDDFNNFINLTYNLHQHPTAAVGAPSPPSIAGTQTAADISGAKVDKVKLP